MSNENDAPQKLDLGPRWSSEEIHIFFESKSNEGINNEKNRHLCYIKHQSLILLTSSIAFKEVGLDWDRIMQELHDQEFTHRTIEHIKSLYFKVSLTLMRLNNLS